MMKRLRWTCSIGILGLLLNSGASWAQSTGELAGRVTDESGAVLPGVTVTATQTNTTFVRTVITDGAGAWVMPNMPTGPYRLEVSLQGFRTYVQTGIVLLVGATPTINASLAVGSLEETVSVEGAAPIVDVRSAGIKEVVENERIVELPLQGRQVTDLIVLAGAAVQTGTATTRSMPGGVNISVAGGLSFGVAYLLDGAMHNNPQDNANLPMPFPDALQEFSVATGGLTAQNGMHSGASVNAVTKSGTNSFHGNAFEFLRDRHFNAKDAFAAIGPDGKKKDDGLRRNQYGGTLGGPVVHNKLFFFGAYQGTITRQVPSANISRVPTAAMLAGDFRAFTSPACNGGRQIALPAPFVNNQINPALFSPAAMNLARRLPTTTDPCGETTWGASNDSDEWQVVGRSDLQATSKHSIFGRYMGTSYFSAPAYSKSDNVLTTAVVGAANLAQSAVIGDTLVFTSTMVNAVRATYNRTAINRRNAVYFEPRDLGANIYSYSAKEMRLTVTGGFGVGESGRAAFGTNAGQFSDDLTLVVGNHQLGVGGSLAYWKFDYLSNAFSGGSYSFGGGLLGSGMAEFLMGRIQSMTHSGPTGFVMDQWSPGTYIQDTWRATNRVTVNAGLRWEPFLGQNVLNRAVYNFSMDNFRKNVTSTVFLKAPAGLIYPGDPGFPNGLTGQNKQWLNLSPRAGVAWDVHGDGRLAVRSSYSLSYDMQTGEYRVINAGAPPFASRILLQDPSGLFDDPYRQVGGDPHPILTNANTVYIPYGSFGVLDPDINAPRIQSWNVTVEQQIGSNWGVAASYLGSYTDRLWNTLMLNPGVFLGLGPCTLQGVAYPVCTTNANLNARRALSLSGENPAAAAKIGPLDLHTDIGSQNYRGLKLSLRRRSASGISLNGNYTIGRCYGDFTNGNGGFPQNSSGFTDPTNHALDRGYCDQDRRHLGVVTAGYQTPTFANPVARAVASNWRVSGVLNARSGSPGNVIAGGDPAFSGIAGQRPVKVRDNPYPSEKTLLTYLDRAAFAQPAPGTLGDFPRNGVTGPGYWDINVALSRIVGFGEAQNIELRVEAFNLLNNFNWGNPVVNLTSGTFGRIQTQAGSPRIIQFGIKYGF